MRRLAISALLLCAGLMSPLEAQETHRRQGFWIGFGLGPGVNLSEGLDGEKLWGGNGYLRLGGTPNSKVLLGGEIIGWAVDYRDVTLSRGNAHFVMMYYPSTRNGFYLKGGVGGAQISRTRVQGNTRTSTDKGGFGAGVGTGLEFKIGRNIYLLPAADFLLQVFEKETDAVLGEIPGTNTLVLFSLGLTWH